MIKIWKVTKMEQLKIVQIDLARQKENLAEIFRFFDFAKKYGYNAVALYLEDRIKTKTYPYASDSESYTEKDVGKIVDYADKVVAFWDGKSKGTLSVIKYAQKSEKPCEIILCECSADEFPKAMKKTAY